MTEENGAGSRRLRVVQWATGTVGACAMRGVLSHPQLELVGAYVYSAAKDGRDVGSLCGVADTGILATRDRDAILALKPDCVLYMPESTDLDDVCAILESGANISTTRADFFNPERMPPEVRARVEAACTRGGSSIYTSGSSPGFITEALPIVLLSLQRRLDLLTIDEFAHCIDSCSDEMLLGVMGFGSKPEVFGAMTVGERDIVFQQSLEVVTEAIGLSIDRWEVDSDHALTQEATKLNQATIDAGTIGAMRHSVTGYRDGRPLIQFRSNWCVTTKLDKDWRIPEDGWRVTVEGDTPLEISIAFPIADGAEGRRQAMPGLTAHRPLNAIPAICAAPPGMLTTADLPQVIARLA